LQLSGTEDVRIELWDSGPARTASLPQNLARPSLSAPSQPSAGGFDLSIAASIVAQHGGHMKVERSRESNLVTIDLPAYSKDTAL
jgi:nitrogen-specific signal transduction histidine kinase